MFAFSGSGESPLQGWVQALTSAAVPEDDAAKIDQLHDLEVLVCAAQARQAQLAAALDASQRARAAGQGEPAARQGRGIAEQVALARRESPHRGRQHLALATVLERELPCTRAAFAAGRITEWRAMTIARETACLSLEDRRAVDRAIAGDPEALEAYSDRVVLAELRKLAARLDPASVAERRRRADGERHVTVRPAPDTMAYLTVLLPVAQAVACYAALTREADTVVVTGDPRSRGQVMADTLVARVTGSTDDSGRPVVPVAVGLVMTDQALLAGAHDTADLEGHGPIPAGLARHLVLAAADAKTRTWLRRLYTHPTTGELVAMDSRQRLFTGNLARYLRHRDQWCRTPWCNAPIRHGDHVTDHADTGTTRATDAQGLCVTCNHAKQATGWHARSSPGPDPNTGHTVKTTTPTGHTYTSTAPPLTGLRRGAYQELWEGHWTLVS